MLNFRALSVHMDYFKMTELEEIKKICAKNFEMLQSCVNNNANVLNRHSRIIMILCICIILMGIGMFLK